MKDSNQFFDHPILNSPYGYPARHWELDDQGQPTQDILENRRPAEFITPIPKPKKRKAKQTSLIFDEGLGLSTASQQYNHTAIINSVRNQVDKWRQQPNSSDWRVTPETARLLQHWRHHNFSGIRPFFCQVEAVETVIWLTEVAPQIGKAGESFLEHLANANHDANPELMRLALKLATGAGKTTVMAMLIAWQTINAARHPQSKRFTRGFLVVAPGLTIKDRLRVLQPNDPDSYYASRELVPSDMLDDVNRAKIVITNYHAFMLRERIDLSKGGRSLLQGRSEELNTLETEGQMLQRVMPDLMGIKNILVLNDEAHHCYREKAGAEDDEELKGDDRKEAEKNKEAARVWITGIEAVNRKLGVSRVIDLSATPFFLSGSGYAEGTLFPWTLSDFSLMDAIECGIVKLPRVPVTDGRLNDSYYVFYPYGEGLPPINSERDLEEHVPTYFKELLLPTKPKLANRNGIKKDNLNWWELLRHRSWQEEHAPKIVSKYFGGVRSFAFDSIGEFVVVVGNAWLLEKGAVQLSITDEEIYLALLGYLNTEIASDLLEYVSIQVSGGQWDLSKKYVGGLPIPNLSRLDAADVNRLIQIGTRISQGTVERWADINDIVLSILSR